MTDDWQVVQNAIGSTWTSDEATNKRLYREAVAALARLREREAQLVESANQAWVDAEARVAVANERFEKFAASMADEIEKRQARVARLEEALERYWAGDETALVDLRLSALAHEEEKT